MVVEPTRSNSRWVLTRAGLLTATLALAACGARRPGAGAAGTVSSGKIGARATPTVSSNILREDYAGSAACQACHGDVVKAWRGSPMHRMTRLPDDTAIRAPFDGRAFHFKGDVARFEQVNGARFVRLLSRTDGERIYRVTKVIGGRYREDFAGREVTAADPAAAQVGDGHAELILPVSYVFQNSSFRLKGYSVMVGERPGLRAGGVWNQTCIFCHNTVPYFDDLWGALHGAGAPGYQGEVVDRVMPASRRMRYLVTDPPALVRALDQERAVLAGIGAPEVPVVAAAAVDFATVRSALRGAISESRARFAPSHFVEIGIGCESCHGGSRAHVDDPRLHPTFEPRSTFLSVAPPVGASAPISAAEWQNRACARCHQVLFSRYGRTWEGGTRRPPGEPGGSHITSGEARDFLLGACARAMSCSTCHDPHAEDKPATLARLATPAGNGVCTGCHPSYATTAALRAHAHHDPARAGASCVACHMPRKNMGLGYELTRYHRIGSPTDKARVEGDRPLECALCHADKTVGALLADMARWWGKRYDGQAIARLYGSPDANTLVATIDRGYAHEQAAAMGSAGAQRYAPAQQAIARQIEGNSYPLVRYYGIAALATIDGKPMPPHPGSDSGARHGGAAPPHARPAGENPKERRVAAPDDDEDRD